LDEVKKLLLASTAVPLIPGVVGAATMGCFFGFAPERMAYSPEPYSFFDVYVFLHSADYYVTAVEYELMTPTDPSHALFEISEITYPDNRTVTLGSPFAGHSIAYWPPLNGYVPGYNLVCTLTCYTTEACAGAGGHVADYPLVIGPHPQSGELRGTFAPENELFPIVGLTSVLCPEQIGLQEESWGAIKSLYR
jgi:hypothetical protein